MIFVVVGLLAITGFAIAVAVEDIPVQKILSSCEGSCGDSNGCSNLSCGAKTGSGCG
jgi:hypothetical protein